LFHEVFIGFESFGILRVANFLAKKGKIESVKELLMIKRRGYHVINLIKLIIFLLNYLFQIYVVFNSCRNVQEIFGTLVPKNLFNHLQSF